MSLLFLLDRILLPDLFFDLFQGLKEELFDFTALVEHHLGKCPHISQLFVLDTQVLTCIDNGLSLLLNDALVLVAHHFFLLFEVADDLGKRLLKYLDFVLVRLNLLCLLGGSLLVLLLSAGVDRDVPLDLLVRFFVLFNLFLLLVELVTLRDRFKG